MSKLFSSKVLTLYIVSIVFLFFYSFTQIDLGLALTRFPVLFNIQRSFQYIGYFNRPLSTFLIGGLILLLFILYFLILKGIAKKEYSRRKIWLLIFFTAGILVFSYNAFSHDLFNYIFDAKIFTKYGENPYEHKALDFPGDPMLGFMHWTHRVYPYGPVWLALSIPLSYLGMQIFLITFFLFKLLAAASYIGTIFFLEKVVKKLSPGRELLSIAFFAFNPLVIVESLVSAHHDIVMMCLAMMSFYCIIRKKYIIAIIFFILSVGIKYATIFLLPIFLLLAIMDYQKRKVSWPSLLTISILLLFFAVIAASQQSGNFQPWYLLFMFPFAAILANKKYVYIPMIALSIITFGVYIPFFYTGKWYIEIHQAILYIFIMIVFLTAALFLITTVFKPKIRSV